MALLAENDISPFPKVPELGRRQSWKGLGLPTWSRRGSFRVSHGSHGNGIGSGGGATEQEILAAMKQVNRSQQSFIVYEETDESDNATERSGHREEDGTINIHNYKDNGGRGSYHDNNSNEVGGNGYNSYTSNTNYSHNHNRFSNSNMYSAPVQLQSESSASTYYHHQDQPGYTQNHPVARRYTYQYHHHHNLQHHKSQQQLHQKQSSVKSMQQFYYSPTAGYDNGDSSKGHGHGGYEDSAFGDGYGRTDDEPSLSQSRIPRYRSSGHFNNERQRQTAMHLRDQFYPSTRARRLSEPPRPGTGPVQGYSYHQRRQQQLWQYHSDLSPVPPSTLYHKHQQDPRKEVCRRQSLRAPIIHKTIAKLTGQSLYHYSGSSASLASASSLSCASTTSLSSTTSFSSSPTTVVSSSVPRSATSAPQLVATAQPPYHSHPHSSPAATVLAIPSPPLPASTIEPVYPDSSLPYTAPLKPKALDHSLISPFSTDTIVVPEQQEQQQEQQQEREQEHQDSQEQHSKSGSQGSESTVQSVNQSGAEQESKGKKAGPTITVNTQLGVASKKDTVDMEATSSTISSPPSSSSSNGSYSLTPNPSVPRPVMIAAPGLVSMGPAGVGSRTGIPPYERREMLDQEHDGDDVEACCSCAVPDWETFKAGLLPTSKQARETLLATVILALVTIALEAVLLQRHETMINGLTGRTNSAGRPYEMLYFRPLVVYYILFILAEIFAVGLLWDAAIHKNSLQLVAFTIFEWCMVSYSGLQIWQYDQLIKDTGIPPDLDMGDSNTRIVLFSQLGVQVMGCLGITLLTWRLYSEFGWLVFQKLGADVSLRRMMKEYRMLFTLLKLDAFFFFGYALQIAVLTDDRWQKGLIEVAFAIPLSAVIILLGFCALRNENKVTMGGFIACLALLIGYMSYRLVALWQTLTGDPATDAFFFSRKTMTVFAALTLLITILALINAIVMLYNFNKGLKEAMQQYRIRRSGTVRSTTGSVHRVSVNGSGLLAIGMPGGHGGHGGHGVYGGYGGHDVIAMGYSGTTLGSGLGPGFGAVSSTGAGSGGGGGGQRPRQNSRQISRKSLVHYEVTTPTPLVSERWEIE